MEDNVTQVNVDDNDKPKIDEELKLHIDRIRGYNSEAFKDLDLELSILMAILLFYDS